MQAKSTDNFLGNNFSVLLYPYLTRQNSEVLSGELKRFSVRMNIIPKRRLQEKPGRECDSSLVILLEF